MKNAYIEKVWNEVLKKNEGQPEFLQAVKEVLSTLSPAVERMPELEKNAVLERLTEPERIIIFRIPWADDKGIPHINRGFRVQFNSAIGPYKGGLRFSPEVNLSVVKFLAFEQVLKNSLTTLPMGGGKGGSDFDPHGKTEAEIMRFCQSFMTELFRHIGADTDVPAGDKGVGAKEVGFLFGQYKRLTNEFTGVLTGKGLQFGGSLVRTEATGYGLIYFAECMLEKIGEGLKNKVCAVSGDGNVAQYAVEKLIQLGAIPVTMSDSSGFIYDPDGIDQEKLEYVKKFRSCCKKIDEYVKKYPNAKFTPNARPWSIKVDCAFPCATQNELDSSDADMLIKNGVKLVAEGANMPSSAEAVEKFQKAGVIFAPGKASNAGGVSVSGLEMSQNSIRLSWTAEDVDTKLKQIMTNIHAVTYSTAEEFGMKGDYVSGANIAGFLKTAKAMTAQGLV